LHSDIRVTEHVRIVTSKEFERVLVEAICQIYGMEYGEMKSVQSCKRTVTGCDDELRK
jgi:hypothetical protein